MEKIISTLTLNPSLDKTMYFDEPFKAGALNRASASVMPIIGSKGINVSRMLRVCGVDAAAWGFMGGENGRLALTQLDAEGISHRFIETEAETRLNIKMIDSSGACTEANERGGPITPIELTALYDALERDTLPGQIFAMGGSVPQGVEKSVYKQLINLLKTRGIYCVLDSDGEALAAGMQSCPALIKPNLYELSLLLGREVTPDGAESECAAFYKATGTEVLCTLGGDGAIFAGAEGVFRVKSPRVTVRGFTGAGDTALAVFLYCRFWRGYDCREALVRANAAAAVKVQLTSTAMPSREQLAGIL
jgi:hexose kinase, 1-phosphofructokinase family